jgi:beta-phosphoglucomutase-like phosphatase (HAD superfamily)
VVATETVVWTPDAVLLDLDGIGQREEASELLAMLTAADLPWEAVPSGQSEQYLKAAQNLGVDPSRCLVIESTNAGVEAGRQAGMLALGVCGVEGDLTLRDLPEATYLLCGLFAP